MNFLDFEIWCEGHNSNGDEAKAHFFGNKKSSSFQQACNDTFGGSVFYNPKTLTFWGHKLFSNEKEARNIFG